MRAVGYKKSHLVADTGRMWTKSIWDTIPWDQIAAGEREGHVFFDDFINVPTLSPASNLGKYASYIDIGGTILGTPQDHGEVALLTDATIQDETWITTGGNVGSMTKFIKQATGVPHTVAFETRIKKDAIAAGGLFVGFANPGLAAANTMADTTTALADNNFVGFQVVEATPTAVDFVHRANGQALVVTQTAADTLVADTYAKWGMKYEYKNANDRQIKIYIDGVLQSTFVTKTAIDAATFPSDDDMALLCGTKSGTAVASVVTMDWWRAAMVVNS